MDARNACYAVADAVYLALTDSLDTSPPTHTFTWLSQTKASALLPSTLSS
jgi:hypothetical protein